MAKEIIGFKAGSTISQTINGRWLLQINIESDTKANVCAIQEWLFQQIYEAHSNSVKKIAKGKPPINFFEST